MPFLLLPSCKSPCRLPNIDSFVYFEILRARGVRNLRPLVVLNWPSEQYLIPLAVREFYSRFKEGVMFSVKDKRIIIGKILRDV